MQNLRKMKKAKKDVGSQERCRKLEKIKTVKEDVESQERQKKLRKRIQHLID